MRNPRVARRSLPFIVISRLDRGIQVSSMRPLGLRAIRVFLLFSATFLSSACYVLKNAYHFTELYKSRQSIEDVLADEKTSERTKEKLRLVQDILLFARQEELNTSGSYRDFIDLGERSVVSYLVQAAEVDQLKLVTWWFPVVGAVPYLGYFQQEERDRKVEKLKGKGYDVFASEVDAFSGLGWFSDPIFSTFLEKRESSLANLLFHELTHATLWVAGDVTFNENLASYVADILTIQYLERRSYAEDLVFYRNKEADFTLFSAWLSTLRAELEVLYGSRGDMSLSQLLVKKEEVFSSFLKERRPRFRTIDFIGDGPWNNATVLAVNLYTPETERFQRAHACVGKVSVGTLLRAIEKALDKVKQPFAALDSLCSIRS
ncbi:MAG: aminopeptidase [Deltaproteobacteria bacterium]|nr:aminopeptidase [Deltaproteobacteria bacterium]